MKGLETLKPTDRTDAKRDMINNRRGIFEIPLTIIYDEPELAMEVLGSVVVVRAEMLLFKDAVEYQAFSPHFEGKSFALAGRYEPIFEENEEGKRVFSGFKEVQDNG